MLTVILDAGLFAIPDYESSSKEDVQQYLDRLLKLNADVFDKPWADVVMSSEASRALAYDKVYPLFDELKSLLKKFDIPQSDANTLHTMLISKLEKNSSFLETKFSIDGVLWETFESDPKLRDLALPPSIDRTHLSNLLTKCILVIAILTKCCPDSIDALKLFVGSANAADVSVRARIGIVEHARDDLPDFSKPVDIRAEVPVCDSVRCLIDGIDESKLLANARIDQEVRLAIDIRIMKKAKGADAESFPTGNLPIELGTEFPNTCRQICRDQSESFSRQTLRSIEECVENRNLSDEHPLRTGAGGNDPQRIRQGDNAKAYRRKINDYYRLHYWKCEDGSIEFGSVNPHDDFSIPE